MKQLFCMLMLAGAVLFSSQTALFADSLVPSNATSANSAGNEEPPKPKKHKAKKIKKAKKKNRFGQMKVGAKKKAYSKKYVVPVYAKF